MKILFITNFLPFPPDTGTRMRSWNFVKTLARHGDVTLMCPGREDEEGKHIPFLRTQCSEVVLIDSGRFGPHSQDGLEMTLLERVKSLVRMDPWNARDFATPEYLRELMAADLSQYDWIVIRYPILAYHFFNEKALRPFLDRIVLDVDDISIVMQERRLKEMQIGYPKIRHWVDLEFLRFYYRNLKDVKACLVVSEADKRFLIRNGYAENVHVLPNVIETSSSEIASSDNFKATPRNDSSRPSLRDNTQSESKQSTQSQTILFCGTLSYPHNVQALAYFSERIFPQIQKAVPDVRLTVVGKNPTPEVKALCRKPGIELVGPVPDTKPYYEKAALSVVPLLNGAGTRIKILESLVYRTPVVSTSIGAEGLDVEDGKQIMIADHPGTFARKCVELLRDPGKRQRLAGEGYELVQSKYDVRVFMKILDELMDSLSKEPVYA